MVDEEAAGSDTLSSAGLGGASGESRLESAASAGQPVARLAAEVPADGPARLDEAPAPQDPASTSAAAHAAHGDRAEPARVEEPEAPAASELPPPSAGSSTGDGSPAASALAEGASRARRDARVPVDAAPGTREAGAHPALGAAPRASSSMAAGSGSRPRPPASAASSSGSSSSSGSLPSSSSGSLAATPLVFRVAGHTDIGLVRESNEDSILIGDLDRAATLELGVADAPAGRGARGPLLIVCDGMGGVAGGEVASDLGVRITWRELASTPGSGDPEVFARLLRRAVRIANAEIHGIGRRDPELRGMGATLTAAAVVGSRLVVANVGDSRAYVLRGDRLVQVSRDQSLAYALAAAGHPVDSFDAGGAILQALGVTPDCEPSLSIIDLRRLDRVLVCSDGLYNLLGEGALGTILADPRGPADAVRLLVDAARAAGGTDNISALVLEVDGERFAEPSDGELPRFREFDPQREGDPALTSTSHVARRLAARIGLSADAPSPAVPVTGQHRVAPRVRRPADEVEHSPSRARLAARGSRWTWLVAIAVALAAVAALALR